MHAAGIGLALAGMIQLTPFTSRLPDLQSASVWTYAIGLVAMFSISAVYNIWPVSSFKLVLRRFDHATIFLFIAATYTPFIAQAEPSAFTKALLVSIWSTAGIGVALKLAFPGRLERTGVFLCLVLGWSGIFAYDAIFRPLPAATVGLIVAGGLLYSGGVVFHLWDRLRYQNAVWHAFVISAAVVQFLAVSDAVRVAASAVG
jgi:hemolysin III